MAAASETHRGHDHRASPAAQPQRDLPGRHPAAPLLPAGAQARERTAGRWCAPRPPATRSSFSAPTARRMRATPRRRACGCAGLYTAHAGIELYAEAFEAAGALDKLEGFASCSAPDFYGLPRNQERLTLRRVAWRCRRRWRSERIGWFPMRAGEEVRMEAGVSEAPQPGGGRCAMPPCSVRLAVGGGGRRDHRPEGSRLLADRVGRAAVRRGGIAGQSGGGGRGADHDPRRGAPAQRGARLRLQQGGVLRQRLRGGADLPRRHRDRRGGGRTPRRPGALEQLDSGCCCPGRRRW